LLILAPVSGSGATLCLLAYGVLFGFNSIGMAFASSMTAEIMPQEQMGRWIGVVGLFRGLLSIPAPTVGGLIWEHIGPKYVFLAAIAIDLCVRLPILAFTRETLHLQQSEGGGLDVDD
jgi:MFS family permease